LASLPPTVRRSLPPAVSLVNPPLKIISRDFRLNSDSDSHQLEAVRKREFEPERESKTLPKVPQLVSSPLGGHPMPKIPFPQSIARTVLSDQ
jgi:hypothetical protein